MSDQTQYLSSITPLIDSGSPPVTVGVAQSLGTNLLTLGGPAAISIQVNGPRTTLTESDIVGVFPAPGSTDSPDAFLPHIVLSSRTLPWERKGPFKAKPWLALLLLKSSEIGGGFFFNGAQQVANLNTAATSAVEHTLVNPGLAIGVNSVTGMQARDPAGFTQVQPKPADTSSTQMLYLRNSVFTAIRPDAAELAFLCNAKRTNSGGGDVDCSIVVGNRLPDASGDKPELHTAFLVSLEGRDDAYAASRAQQPNAEIGLVVLHSWSFTPSKGGDFEEVIQAIRIRPNGGVQRFGNLPQDTPGAIAGPLLAPFESLLDQHGLFVDPLPHTQAGLVSYRGPLRPFPPPPRSAGYAVRSAPEEFANAALGEPLDYSNATAFELGRLLALSSQDTLEDLRQIRALPPTLGQQFVAINKLPLALQKPDWVVNPVLEETQPWELSQGSATTPLVKSGTAFVGNAPGDVSGVSAQIKQLGTQVQQTLASLETVSAQQISQIDFNTVTVAQLEVQFNATKMQQV